MNCIIAGSRMIMESFEHISKLHEVMDNLPKDWPEITKIFCGCALGVDRMGFSWARTRGIPVEFFPAWQGQSEWAFHNAQRGEIIHECPSGGKRAGFQRNINMAWDAGDIRISVSPPFGIPQTTVINPGALVLLWNGTSLGSAHMKAWAQVYNLLIHEEIIK